MAWRAKTGIDPLHRFEDYKAWMDGLRELGVWAEVVEWKFLGFGGCSPGEKRATAAMSTYSGSWSCSRRSVLWKPKMNSKNSSWNPAVGDTRLRSLQVTSPRSLPKECMPSTARAPSYLVLHLLWCSEEAHRGNFVFEDRKWC